MRQTHFVRNPSPTDAVLTPAAALASLVVLGFAGEATATDSATPAMGKAELLSIARVADTSFAAYSVRFSVVTECEGSAGPWVHDMAFAHDELRWHVESYLVTPEGPAWAPPELLVVSRAGPTCFAYSDNEPFGGNISLTGAISKLQDAFPGSEYARFLMRPLETTMAAWPEYSITAMLESPNSQVRDLTEMVNGVSCSVVDYYSAPGLLRATVWMAPSLGCLPLRQERIRSHGADGSSVSTLTVESWVEASPGAFFPTKAVLMDGPCTATLTVANAEDVSPAIVVGADEVMLGNLWVGVPAGARIVDTETQEVTIVQGDDAEARAKVLAARAKEAQMWRSSHPLPDSPGETHAASRAPDPTQVSRAEGDLRVSGRGGAVAWSIVGGALAVGFGVGGLLRWRR